MSCLPISRLTYAADGILRLGPRHLISGRVSRGRSGTMIRADLSLMMRFIRFEEKSPKVQCLF